MNIYFSVFAVFLVIGGFIGFKKAGSVVSLWAGIISGVVIGAGVYMGSLELIAAASALLVASFIGRLIKTKKFMPAGMLLILSLISTVLTLLQLFG